MERHSITCPNCGSIMNECTIVATCNYCGCSIPIDKSCSHSKTNEKTIGNRNAWQYVSNNIDYIQARKWVKVEDQGDTYTISSQQIYYPYQGLRLNKDLGWRISATISPSGTTVQLHLVSQDDRPFFFAIKCDKATIMKESQSCISPYIEFTLDEFAEICSSKELIVETNVLTGEYYFVDFSIYLHRFFNIVFDKTKYIYSIHQHISIDN